MPVHDVAVVGGGIAGLACAIACANAGAAVMLFEQDLPEGSRSGPLNLVPNLLRDLATLGLGDDCVRSGFSYSGLRVVDNAGRTSVELAIPRMAGNQLPAAIGISYESLINILRTHALAAGVAFRSGVAVASLDEEKGRIAPANAQPFAADLIVLATGADSPLANQLFGSSLSRGTPFRWAHTSVVRPPWLDRATWVTGLRDRRYLLVPTAVSSAGITALELNDRGEELFDQPLLNRLCPDTAKHLRPSTGDRRQSVARSVRSHLLDPPWHRGCVLAVGAAAHAIAPPFGQSPALAIEDAIVLGALIHQGFERPRLLEVFMEQRWTRTKRVHTLVDLAIDWIAHPDPSTDFVSLARELNSVVGTAV